jgi:BMFP domain-containing protein YqiC
MSCIDFGQMQAQRCTSLEGGAAGRARILCKDSAYNTIHRLTKCNERRSSAMRPNVIEQILQAVAKTVPQGLTQDIEKNLRGVLRGVFDRLDLVTREELEVQEQVLARTRERLKEMEKRLTELEARPPKP